MLFSLPIKWEANNVSTRIPPKQKVLKYCFASAIRIPYSEIIRIFRCLPFNLKFPFNLGCKQRFLLGTPYLKPRDNAGITQHLESNPTQPRVLTCFYWDGKSRLLRSVQGWTDREAYQTTGKCILRMIISSFVVLMWMWGRGGGKTAKGQEELIGKESSHESLIKQPCFPSWYFFPSLHPDFSSPCEHSVRLCFWFPSCTDLQ